MESQVCICVYMTFYVCLTCSCVLKSFVVDDAVVKEEFVFNFIVFGDGDVEITSGHREISFEGFEVSLRGHLC
jgi:hypothetical protein